MVPMRKFSSSTSDSAISRFATESPSGVRRSAVTLFLLRLYGGKNRLAPSPPYGATMRLISPVTGFSILMTSAPMSASSAPRRVLSPFCRPAAGVLQKVRHTCAKL